MQASITSFFGSSAESGGDDQGSRTRSRRKRASETPVESLEQEEQEQQQGKRGSKQARVAIATQGKGKGKAAADGVGDGDNDLSAEQAERVDANKAAAKLKLEKKRVSPLLAHLSDDWYLALKQQWKMPYFSRLDKLLDAEFKAGKPIFPPLEHVFNAYNSCPLDRVKVVLLGQDPYHGPGQAHGLCFSVQKGVAIPPSLRNMYKELAQEYPGEFDIPKHGYLQQWADQGVLMLNATLTVHQAKPNSHKDFGWQSLTDATIRLISQKRKDVVFLLWGGFAIKKKKLIDASKHCVLECVHPSPLSASRGWFGSNIFRRTNEELVKRKVEPINWTITP